MVVLSSWIMACEFAVLTVRFESWKGFRIFGLSIGTSVALQLVSLPFWWFFTVGLYKALIGIERLGIRFFGRRRGWRVTPAVSRTVCAHASIGWVLGAFLPGVVISLFAVVMLPLVFLVTRQMGGPSTGGPEINSLPFFPFLMLFYAIPLGLIFFELQVFLGVRACKFANPPRPPNNNSA